MLPCKRMTSVKPGSPLFLKNGEFPLSKKGELKGWIHSLICVSSSMVSFTWMDSRYVKFLPKLVGWALGEFRQKFYTDPGRSRYMKPYSIELPECAFSIIQRQRFWACLQRWGQRAPWTVADVAHCHGPRLMSRRGWGSLGESNWLAWLALGQRDRCFLDQCSDGRSFIEIRIRGCQGNGQEAMFVQFLK